MTIKTRRCVHCGKWRWPVHGHCFKCPAECAALCSDECAALHERAHCPVTVPDSVPVAEQMHKDISAMARAMAQLERLGHEVPEALLREWPTPNDWVM